MLESAKYWDWKNGTLLATQLFFTDNSSAVYTPEGYFDYVGKSALNYISFTSPYMQNGFLDLQDIMNDYYMEDLLESVLDGSFKPNRKNNLVKGVETAPLVKGLFEPQKLIDLKEDLQELSFTVSENGSKLDHAALYVEGILADSKTLEDSDSVKVLDDSKENFFKYMVSFKVPLNYGTNRVEVKVFNEYKIPQSYPVFELVRKKPENADAAKPDLYVLSVGINHYKKKELKYSISDAEAVADVLKDRGDLYQNVYVKLLKDAKKKEIEEALEEIISKAKPQDVVVLYMSGHGMNAVNREGTKKLFYFVPQDFKWPNDPENENVAKNQGIDADYLNDTFTKIRAHKLILILDACHSGSVNVALASKGSDKEKATKKAMEKMANGTGRFIFASSSGNEESREHREVEHGLYTYVLLNALGKSNRKDIPNADYINKDGFVYLSEIRTYIEQKFEEQTEKYLKTKDGDTVIQTPPSISLGRNSMYERVNDFPLIKVKK